MPITLGSNISSLQAQRRLVDSSSQLSKTHERLSSGLRINRASDDAAGLAIAEALRSDSRVFSQGIRNLNDGISLLAIADNALENLTTITVRLKELAEQSANGVYSVSQRAALNKEAQSLSKEYTRIIKTTTFNGINLFSSTTGNIRLQAGYGVEGSISSGLGGAVGTGTFGSATTAFDTTSSSTTIGGIGDINNDGNIDFAVTEGRVYLGSGTGTFTIAGTYSEGVYALADFNNDGNLDLGSTTTVRLGNGNGSFGSTISSNLTAIGALADMNGDGILDNVIGRTGSGATAAYTDIYYGNGDGTFGVAVSNLVVSGASSFGASRIRLLDMNNDGITDVVSNPSSGGISYISVQLGTGGGGLGAAQLYNTGTGSNFDARDFNNDGIGDAVYITTGFANILLGNGSGGFTSVGSYTATSTPNVAVGDMNGDGNVDYVTHVTATSGLITYRLGNGDGTFGAVASMQNYGGRTMSVYFPDINNDGVPDLLTSGGSNTILASSDGYYGVNLSSTTQGASQLLPFSLSSIAESKQALSLLDHKLRHLTAQRAQIGAFQSRVEVASNTLQATRENYLDAESRIRDADIAQEAADLARLSILQQASAAILAQANQQPALVLKLLGEN